MSKQFEVGDEVTLTVHGVVSWKEGQALEVVTESGYDFYVSGTARTGVDIEVRHNPRPFKNGDTLVHIQSGERYLLGQGGYLITGSTDPDLLGRWVDMGDDFDAAFPREQFKRVK